MSLSAKDLIQTEKKRNFAKKEYYKALLEQFCRKIKCTSERGERRTIVSVPSFLVGFPKYDLSVTVMYMARQLTRLGYTVNMVGPLDLSVSWSPDDVPDQPPEEETRIVMLPSLANLKKTAQKLRKK